MQVPPSPDLEVTWITQPVKDLLTRESLAPPLRTDGTLA
jgi:hypothetical protein